MSRRTPPKLSVITPLPALPSVPAPDQLDQIGAHLWREVTAVFEWDDPSSYEVLAQACAARSRAARCSEAINRDGEMIRTKTGFRDHPLIKHEIAARALCCRLLSRLGMDVEPLRPGVGRPPGGGVGISHEQLRRAD